MLKSKLKYIALSLSLALMPFSGAYADNTANQVVPGTYVNPGTSPCPSSSITPCWTPNDATHPIYVTPEAGTTTPTTVTNNPWVAVAPTQTGLAIATSTTPTVPATVTILLIQPQGTNNSSGVCLFWQDDGTAPTGTTGQALSALQPLVYKVTGSPIQLIAATGATCTVTISYYKDAS